MTYHLIWLWLWLYIINLGKYRIVYNVILVHTSMSHILILLFPYIISLDGTDVRYAPSTKNGLHVLQNRVIFPKALFSILCDTCH